MTLALTLLIVGATTGCAQTYPDRFIFIYSPHWGLRQDGELELIQQTLITAAAHGYNGLVLGGALDRLSMQPPVFFTRLSRLAQTCEDLDMKLIPMVFSAGYGGSVLDQNPHLAEGFPVKDAEFRVGEEQAWFRPDPSIRVVNGDFTRAEGDRLAGMSLQHKPGVVTHVDRRVTHDGATSVRLDNFQANGGHARLAQEIAVVPHRCYEVEAWVRTADLEPPGRFRFEVLGLPDGRDIAPTTLKAPPPGEWTRMALRFNSLKYSRIRLTAGVWAGRRGTAWFSEWNLREVGPVNVLRRPGTPVTVRSADGSTTYEEGADYAPLVDPQFSHRDPDHPAPPLTLLPGGRIREGQRLKVSWYHSVAVAEGQRSVCMAEPELYEIWKREAKLLADLLHPAAYLLSMDEIREGGHCAACGGRDMSQLLGECLTKQKEILHEVSPGAQIYTWADMLSPEHNARANYYLVNGDFSRAWEYAPKDLIMVVWAMPKRITGVRFFSQRGFSTLIGAYYDKDNLSAVEDWVRVARGVRGLRGIMYTTWQQKFDLVAPFGDLVWGGAAGARSKP